MTDAQKRSSRTARAPTLADVQIGVRLRLQRKRAGLSQAELGARVGLSFQQMQKYERAINRISAGKLHEVACALSVHPSVFFEGLTSYASPDPDGSTAASPALSVQELAFATAFAAISSDLVRRRLAALAAAIAGQEDCHPVYRGQASAGGRAGRSKPR